MNNYRNAPSLTNENFAVFARAQLNARIDAIAKSGIGGLVVPLTPGPFFVLLALAEGAMCVQPTYNSPQDAVEELRSASPCGYAIANRTHRLPARTYCSDEPHRLAEPRHAYVHVHDDSLGARQRGVRDAVHVAGMIEIACAMPVDPSHGITGLHGLASSAARDANALQAALARLGLGSEGPLFVVAAALQMDGLRVSEANEMTNSIGVVGTLQTPVVRLMPQLIAHMKELTGPRLTALYSMLWARIQEETAESKI